MEISECCFGMGYLIRENLILCTTKTHPTFYLKAQRGELIIIKYCPRCGKYIKLEGDF